MKLGTESRWKTIAAVALVCVAAYVIVRAFTSTAVPVPAVTAPEQGAATGTATAPRRQPGRSAAVLTQSLDPRLRLDLLNLSQNTKYEGRGRNIFRGEAEPQEEIEPVSQAPTNPTPVNTGPPPPPPINMKFFGFASSPGEAKRVFLSQDGDIFVASEGEIVNRRYRVVRINANSVEIEDVLDNRRQSIPLQQG